MKVVCHQVSHHYHTPQGPLAVLEDVTFAVREQEFVACVGPSGCGKTTLLKVLSGLIQPTTGRIEFDSPRANGQPPHALVFQEHGLFPWLTVEDNVAFGQEMRGVGKRERRERARDFLVKVGLEKAATCFPHQLSVGMCQRAAIARAFVADPQVLLMDEPFSALDAQTRLILQAELLRIWRDHRQTVIYVTHDIEEALLMSDRVLVFTAKPARIQAEIAVPLPRPRTLFGQDEPLIREMKWQIWRMLTPDVTRRQ
jgi:NitT/TauT family transport system ATP-binding protein